MTDFFLPLFVVLTFTLTFTIIYHKFDFLEPSVIVVSMMTIGAFMSVIMAERWGLAISFKGFCFILAVLFAFILGGYFAKKCFGNKKVATVTDNSRHTYDISPRVVACVTFLMLVMLFFNIERVHGISMEYGNRGGIDGYFNMIRVVRPLLESGEMPSFGLQFGVFFNLSRLIAYIFIYLFAYNLLYSKAHRADFLLLIPVLLEIPFQILTTGRLGLFIAMVYALVVSLMLYQKGKNYSFKSKLNALKIIVAGGILFIGAFLILGHLTWKGVTESRTPLIILSHYAGLSVPALDTLTQMTLAESEYIGTHTLQGFYRVLHAIFPNIPAVAAFLPFVQYNGIDTNVFSMFGQYLMDYGYIGALALSAIFGFIYTVIYTMVKYRSKNIETPIIMYGYIAYPLFLSSISERIFMDFTNTAGAFAVLLFILIKIIFSERVLNGKVNK